MDKDSLQYDQLTGLLGRDSFHHCTRRQFKKYPDETFALMLVDINRLTMINELFGLNEGDKLLKYLGNTLQRVFLGVQGSNCARLQADLFAVSFVYHKEDVEKYISLIESEIKKYSLSLNIDILLSFGIYIVEDKEMEGPLMRDRASLALKSIKGNYIRHYAFYDADMRERVLKEQRITQTMSRALEKKEFLVYFQPKHSLEDGTIIGAEALVRWISPEKGTISPGEFIPIFEENGFIMKLDMYVWEEACRFLREQMDKGNDIVPISVNISRIDLYNPELCSFIKGLVEKYDIPRSKLELEFTESAFMDNPQLLIQTMSTLRDYGFTVEIDDFGSGYSSLNMLKDAPVDVLKIDLHFLSKGDNGERADSIMSAIVRMAKMLGMLSIVEGVETQAQIDFLKTIGCTMAQGYYFAKPMPWDEFVEYIISCNAGIEPRDPRLSDSFKSIDPEIFWNETVGGPTGIGVMCDACMLIEDYGDRREVLKVNETYFETFGFPNMDCSELEEHIHRTGNQDELGKFLRDIFETAADGRSNGTGVFTFFKNGEPRDMYARGRLISVRHGRNIYFVVMQDLTNKLNI